jgi:adenosylcobinamide-GDP ribazoletransferase
MTVAPALIAAAALSRAAMPVAMWLLPQARTEGLAASAGRPQRGRVLVGVGVGVVVSFLCVPVMLAFVAMAVSIAVGALALGIARRQISGITGDVIGGQQQSVEMGSLFVFVASPGSSIV